MSEEWFVYTQAEDAEIEALHGPRDCERVVLRSSRFTSFEDAWKKIVPPKQIKHSRHSSDPYNQPSTA